MVVNIGFGTVSYNGWRPSLLQQTVNKLALAYFEFVDRPHVFDNLNQLIEVDAVYNELREQHPQADRNKYNFHKISNERNAVRCVVSIHDSVHLLTKRKPLFTQRTFNFDFYELRIDSVAEAGRKP